MVVLTILKNMKVNGKDYPICYGKIKNVPNHQPKNVWFHERCDGYEYPLLILLYVLSMMDVDVDFHLNG